MISRSMKSNLVKICFYFVMHVVAVNSLQSSVIKVPQEYQTIQSAIDSCRNSDTILVDKGRYSEKLIISKPLTIIGTERDSVIITLDDGRWWQGDTIIHIDKAQNVSLEGLRIIGQDGYLGPVVPENALYVSFSHDIHLLNVYANGGRGWNANPDVGACNGAWGMAVDNSQNISIDSCKIYGGDGGNGYYNPPHGSKPWAHAGNSLVFINNSTGTVNNSLLRHSIRQDSSSTVSLTNTLIVASVPESGSSIEKRHGFRLSQNYPNPFNPATTITYELSTNGNVCLNVYDITGRQLESLVNERQTAGSHSIVFKAMGFPSGVYFYTLEVGQFRETKKLILLK